MKLGPDDPVLPKGRSLFEEYFLVRFNGQESRSLEDVRLHGTPYSEVPELNDLMQSSFVTAEHTIDMMFEKWRRGVTIRVVNYNDTARIYRIIESHLETWLSFFRLAMNIGNAPIQDLIELDEFASVVYDNARNVLTNERVVKELQSIFGKQTGWTANNLFQKAPEKFKYGTPGKERRSLKDFLDQQYARYDTNH